MQAPDDQMDYTQTLAQFVSMRCLEKVQTGSPRQGDLRFSDPPSGQGAGGGAPTRDRRVPADLRADSLSAVPPTPPN
ncbi:hypothetical protein PoB_003825900 [Plakobranchus ocellatus]|uniref:Uncharacterized protein n=1 Tax=Plakobranchus ocellatus TaxID=259542 RepID=A0AAV4AZE7_9GAST|nr:hypothetical protein PoB_003825900 [Plakobranchus ocellatus]